MTPITSRVSGAGVRDHRVAGLAAKAGLAVDSDGKEILLFANPIIAMRAEKGIKLTTPIYKFKW